MATKYWIKLYHEMLDDPKMCRLPDRLYRRVIECFLLAGNEDSGGLLPELSDIAWRFRCDEEQLETELIELSRVGILSQKEGRWIVTKFAERQDKLSKAEYMRRLRDSQKKREHYESTYQPRYQSRYQSVTNGNTEENRIEKNRRELEEKQKGRASSETPGATGLVNALAAICSETLAPGFNEKKYHDAADVLRDRGVVVSDVESFGLWWGENGWHGRRPAVKNVLDHWRDFKDGRSLREPAKKGETAEEYLERVLEDDS